MEPILLSAAVIQNVAISLGVGTSTLAIVSFFGAIADGTIDATERHMLGLIYYVLRVAMVLILLTMLVLFAVPAIVYGSFTLSTYQAATIILVAILYINAILMTLKIMPSTFGPGIQAASWYSLGFMASFQALGLVTFGLLPFFLGYLSFVCFAIALVNGVMAILKAKQHTQPPTPPATA